MWETPGIPWLSASSSTSKQQMWPLDRQFPSWQKKGSNMRNNRNNHKTGSKITDLGYLGILALRFWSPCKTWRCDDSCHSAFSNGNSAPIGMKHPESTALLLAPTIDQPSWIFFVVFLSWPTLHIPQWTLFLDVNWSLHSSQKVDSLFCLKSCWPNVVVSTRSNYLNSLKQPWAKLSPTSQPCPCPPQLPLRPNRLGFAPSGSS